jgi:hypothetical protein
MFNFVVKRFRFLSKIPLLVHIFDALLLLHSFLFNNKRFKVICAIEAEVKTWKDVGLAMHHFGGMQINYGKVELGHIHGNGLLDLYVGTQKKQYFIEHLHCVDHHVLDKSSSWVSFWIKEQKDYERAMNILKEVYLDRNDV